MAMPSKDTSALAMAIATPAGRDSLAEDAGAAGLRAELETIPKVSGLKKRAREAGIDEEKVHEADDADDVREFLISLILEKEIPAKEEEEEEVKAAEKEETAEEKAEEIPEEASKEKKKKKKQKKVDIEDMFSFDLTMMKEPKAKPAKKKEEDGITKKGLSKALKAFAKIAAQEEPKTEAQGSEEVNDVKTKEEDSIHIPEPKVKEDEEQMDSVLLRCPSPSRSRQSSPKKREESPKKREEKPSTPLKATAFEFVPPGFSSPPKATSSLQASAAEFVPPGVEPKVAKPEPLKASAAEFVPPGFEPKVAEPEAPRVVHPSEFVPPGYEPKVAEAPAFEPPKSDSSSQAVWSHAVFTPSNSLESTQQQQPALAKVPVPKLALNTVTAETNEAVDLDNKDKWSARVQPGGILDRVKQSLTARLGLRPDNRSTADPCIGKVHDKVKKIEEQEAENEAEKQREAAIKAVNDAAKHAEKQAILKEKQKEMDEALMDCFLQAVTTHVKDRDLPMMGTTLYGKHMRSSRRKDTSCDVKDSSFVWLRPFLESLEDDGLIELKPEVKDPTVIWINRSHPLIKKWQPWAYSETVGYKKGVARR